MEVGLGVADGSGHVADGSGSGGTGSFVCGGLVTGGLVAGGGRVAGFGAGARVGVGASVTTGLLRPVFGPGSVSLPWNGAGRTLAGNVRMAANGSAASPTRMT